MDAEVAWGFFSSKIIGYYSSRIESSVLCSPGWPWDPASHNDLRCSPAWEEALDLDLDLAIILTICCHNSCVDRFRQVSVHRRLCWVPDPKFRTAVLVPYGSVFSAHMCKSHASFSQGNFPGSFVQFSQNNSCKLFITYGCELSFLSSRHCGLFLFLQVAPMISLTAENLMWIEHTINITYQGMFFNKETWILLILGRSKHLKVLILEGCSKLEYLVLIPPIHRTFLV